jgi:hypothetical protein
MENLRERQHRKRKKAADFSLKQRHACASVIPAVFAAVASVAQLDRASDFGSEGWGFESLPMHHSLLIDAVTDPEVPPLPPHITLTQARHFISPLIGDPARGRRFTQSVKDRTESFAPHRS